MPNALLSTPTVRISPELAADAVIASYIHAISARHGDRTPPRPPRELEDVTGVRK